jgi:D-glycero-alpha-D-manno-heptose-7-phosphate kinase
MSIIFRSRAPVRLDLAGGWTDVPPFAEREGGAVVNLAVNRYTYASLRERAGASVRLRSDDYDAVVEARSVDELHYNGTLDLPKAALKRMGVRRGVELTTRSDAPPGSGLGTSAAMGVALIGVLDAFGGARLSPAERAALATALEIEELRIAGGKQDQLAAALGGVNYLEFGPHAPHSAPLQLHSGVRNELEKRLVLCYSGMSRLSGDIIQRVQHAYNAGEPATCEALRTMRDLAQVTRTALLDGAVDDLGPILRLNWRCQRALHPSVTTVDVDRLFAAAETQGALGGKACGAGGGGCLLFLAAPDAERELRRALLAAGAQIVDFNLDQAGLQTWRIDEATGRVISSQ